MIFIVCRLIVFMNNMGSSCKKKMKKRSPLQINLGSKIRMLRKQKGMSQEAFAMAIGFHRTYIGMVERGEKNLTIESLDKICT